ncbi:MAG: peptidase S41 [Symploca sp. SIO2B6]|nr:peptidase S41 [Symploca sp. SIO2B6]
MVKYDLEKVSRLQLTEERKELIVKQALREEREIIVEQALLLIDEVYVNLPLKRARNAIDPVQRLKLLKYRLADMDELSFQKEMLSTFMELRDLHTMYTPPAPYSGMWFELPFLIEEFYEGNERQYMVSHLNGEFENSSFKRGVIITHWNGIPMERAVELNAERTYGSNRHASRARGLESMTNRSSSRLLIPDEEWVDLRYITDRQEEQEIRLNWEVWGLPPEDKPEEKARKQSDVAFVNCLGIDWETESIRQIKKARYAPAKGENREEHFENDFVWKIIKTSHGEFGHIRIHTFMIYNVEQFIDDLIGVLEYLPQKGLIIDVRGNGGGYIMAGEMMLQLFTSRKIEPERFQFLNTPTTLKLASWPWQDSIRRSIETGAVYSQGFPIMTGYFDDYSYQLNQYGQKYKEPVLLITDALCYSTTDMFAAGFQDHEIGPILGTSGNTGAGGANVWEYDSFYNDLDLKPLPQGGSFRLAVRRSTRVGQRIGFPLEDFGVVPDYIHNMTKNDLLKDNVDLFEHAASILAAMTEEYV